MKTENLMPRIIASALPATIILLLAAGSAAAAERVDVTGRLVREFHVPEARRKQPEQLKAAAPVPLWRARLMDRLHLI